MSLTPTAPVMVFVTIGLMAKSSSIALSAINTIEKMHATISIQQKSETLMGLKKALKVRQLDFLA